MRTAPSPLLLGALLCPPGLEDPSLGALTLHARWLWSPRQSRSWALTRSAAAQASPGRARSPASVAKATSFPCLHEGRGRWGWKGTGISWVVQEAGGGEEEVAEPCKGA